RFKEAIPQRATHGEHTADKLTDEPETTLCGAKIEPLSSAAVSDGELLWVPQNASQNPVPASVVQLPPPDQTH
ncbi:hypothetical protein, partial [Rubripirellula obstinata]|uniref:hypothetical protein n=1 Tax=Rubripirellula obstinata TaxID=406547 RepID=UPI001EE3FCA0